MKDDRMNVQIYFYFLWTIKKSDSWKDRSSFSSSWTSNYCMSYQNFLPDRVDWSTSWKSDLSRSIDIFAFPCFPWTEIKKWQNHTIFCLELRTGTVIHGRCGWFTHIHGFSTDFGPGHGRKTSDVIPNVEKKRWSWALVCVWDLDMEEFGVKTMFWIHGLSLLLVRGQKLLMNTVIGLLSRGMVVSDFLYHGLMVIFFRRIYMNNNPYLAQSSWRADHLIVTVGIRCDLCKMVSPHIPSTLSICRSWSNSRSVSGSWGNGWSKSCQWFLFWPDIETFWAEIRTRSSVKASEGGWSLVSYAYCS